MHEKAPRVTGPGGPHGARGIRTPKPFRALAFEASAIPFCQRSKQRRAGAAGSPRSPRFAGGCSGRRGVGQSLLPLEDPVAIRHDRFADNQSGRPDVPVFSKHFCRLKIRSQSVTTASRTINRGARIRTGDLCDPNAALYRTDGAMRRRLASHRISALRAPHSVARLEPTLCSSSKITWVRTDCKRLRTGWDSNPRGLCPHDFQSCALSHSATRPTKPWAVGVHDRTEEWD